LFPVSKYLFRGDPQEGGSNLSVMNLDKTEVRASIWITHHKSIGNSAVFCV